MNGILKQYFQTNSYKKLEKSEPENQAGPQDQIHIDLDDVDTNHASEKTEDAVADPNPFRGYRHSIDEIDFRLKRQREQSSNKLPAVFARQLEGDMETFRLRENEDQNRIAARAMRAARIREDYNNARSRAAKTGQMLFNPERNLQFYSRADFDELDTAQHTDQYFVTDFIAGDLSSFNLQYINQAGQRIAIPFINEEAKRLFHNVIVTRFLNKSASEMINLTEDEFICMITDGTTDAHYNTSLAAQKLVSERTATAYFGEYRKRINTDFVKNKWLSNKTNEQIHHENREFILTTKKNLAYLDPMECAGKYLIVAPALYETAKYELCFFDLNGQCTEIPIPTENQAEFERIAMHVDHESYGARPSQKIILSGRDVLSFVTKSSMRGDNPATAHYSTSRISQNIRTDKMRAFQFSQHWEGMGRSLDASVNNAVKTNALIHSGARAIQSTSEAELQDMELDREQHADEYFIVRNPGNDDSFTLYYFNKSGQREKITIQAGQQQTDFNHAMSTRFPPGIAGAACTLSHNEFVTIVTNNTLVAASDKLEDRFVEDAHFSTSREAQHLKSRRMLAMQERIAKLAIEKSIIATEAQIQSNWNNRNYALATGQKIALLIQKAGDTVVDASAAVAIGLVRSVWNSGDFVCSQLARLARRIEPWLSAAPGYGWYGIKRAFYLALRPIEVPGKYICSQLARAGRFLAPYAQYGASWFCYGMAKLSDSAGRTLSGSANMICERLAQVGREAKPHLTLPFVWAKYYLSNTWVDAGLSVSRAWHDYSLSQTHRRLDAERLLFSSSGNWGSAAS